MGGSRVLLIFALVLSVVPGAAAQQKKFKDEGLQQYLIPELTQLQAKLDKMAEKIAALELELGKFKEQQAPMAEDHRRAQELMRATDSSVTSLKVSTQQDLLTLKSDVGQIRRDLTELADLLRRGASSAQSPAPVANSPPPAPAPTTDGYVTQVSDTEVTINLGSASGVRVGMRFSVYHGADLQTRIGIVEITDVMDANNSHARILETKPDTKFQFSDVVRPL